MKKLLSSGFILAFISVCFFTFGQNQQLNELSITPPSFHSSYYENINELLEASIEYPVTAINEGRQGTEVIRFVITPNGKIEDFYVLNSVSKEIDETVIRALQTSNGLWNPGMIDEEPSAMVKQVSVTFVRNSLEDMMKTANRYMQKANKRMFILQKPEKALKFYNQAAVLLPNNECVILVQSYCLKKLGYNDEAKKNLERIWYSANNNKTISIPVNKEIRTENNLFANLVVKAK